MSAVAVDLLPDVQARGDARGVALDAVGVAGVALPLSVLAPDGSQQSTVAEAELTVALTAEVRRLKTIAVVFHDNRQTRFPTVYV